MTIDAKGPAAAERPVILLTKTCAKDLHLLAGLCESLRSVRNDLPHVVIVDADAMADARTMLADFDVELRCTSDVLPRTLHWMARLLWPAPATVHIWHRMVRKAITSTVGSLDGWWLQQIAKLGAARLFPGSVLVLVDSDCVFLDRPTRGWFVSDGGRAKLFQAAPKSLQQLEWRIRVHRHLSIKRYWERPEIVFTQMPQVFDTAIVERLIGHLEGLSRYPWWRTVLRQRLPEMELYGSFAAYVDAAQSVDIEACGWAAEVSSWDRSSANGLVARLEQPGGVRLVALQSTADDADRRAALTALRLATRQDGGGPYAD